MEKIKFLGRIYEKRGFEGRPDGEFVCDSLAENNEQLSSIWFFRQRKTQWEVQVFLNKTRIECYGRSKQQAVKALEDLFKTIAEFV